jgi:hypothetical protein
MPRLWRGELPPKALRKLESPGYEGAKARAAVRNIAVLAVGGAVWFATWIAFAFVNPKGTAAYVLLGLVVIEMVVFFGLLTLIALFNQPKCIIPPMMRVDDPPNQ